jgi:hypothetical protein
MSNCNFPSLKLPAPPAISLPSPLSLPDLPQLPTCPIE